ncbi:MAG: hypothetical protein Q8O43_00100 [Dehalococcoidia bacterium]|nr:hypothetical protein [Dehalococcoidia bacterium]
MTKKSGFFILDGADVIGMIDSGKVRPPNIPEEPAPFPYRGTGQDLIRGLPRT